MSRARMLGLVSALAVLLGGAVASATMMRALDVVELTRQADAVVVGRVLSVGEVVTSVEGRLTPRTVTRVRVLERLRGEASDELTVIEPEGRLGSLVVHRDGLANMRRGQNVLLFLRRAGAGHRPVGHSQGAFVLRTDRPSGETRIERAGDPGTLIGSTKVLGLDLDERPSFDRVRGAIAQAASAP